MEAAEWIALAALLVAVLGYFLNRRAITSEATDRKAQLALLERQVEGVVASVQCGD